MSRWFRVYDDLVDDPKIQRLPGDVVKSLLNLWCLASQNDGLLPAVDDIAFKLRMKPAKVENLLSVLGECGLIDSDETGLRPHNWAGRQYQSDTSKERVQRHRDKRAAAGLIPQWTAPAALRKSVYEADNFECVYCGSAEFLSIDHKTSELNGGTHDLENLVTACRACNGAKRDMSFDEYVTKTKIVTLHGRYLKRPQSTDNRTEQTTEQIDISLRSDDWPEDFGDQFWQAYPRKTEKLAAMRKLASIRKSGIVTFADLLAGVKRYAAANNEPKFTKHPTTWLNAGCWADETQPGGTNGNRNHPASRGSRSDDFFAGMRSVAQDLAGDSAAPGPAAEEIPRGRVEIDG